MASEYDPLTYENIGKSVVTALLSQELHELSQRPDFDGAGVYAIYYTGDSKAYAPITGKETPIYVGKAIPQGRRKGQRSDEESTALAKRLGDHASSIGAVASLNLADFKYRALVVKEVWIGLAEQILIGLVQPVWNCVVDGFGNHNPGSGRKDMIRPRWDTLHPGRTWAAGLTQKHTEDDILASIGRHFAVMRESVCGIEVFLQPLGQLQSHFLGQ